MIHSQVRSGTGRPNSLEVREHRRPSPSVKMEWYLLASFLVGLRECAGYVHTGTRSSKEQERW